MLPVQSEELRRCKREDHPQLSTNKRRTVLELEHRGPQGSLKKRQALVVGCKQGGTEVLMLPLVSAHPRRDLN